MCSISKPIHAAIHTRRPVLEGAVTSFGSVPKCRLPWTGSPEILIVAEPPEPSPDMTCVHGQSEFHGQIRTVVLVPCKESPSEHGRQQ
jgi:hypothetical protein